MDLGRTPKEPTEAAPASPDSPKVTYPSFNINDEVADAFAKEYPDCEMGEEFEAKVKLRINSQRKDEYGNSVGFEILSLDKTGDGDEPAGEGEEAETPAEATSEEDDSDEKVLGFKLPKKNKTVPDTSAADIKDY